MNPRIGDNTGFAFCNLVEINGSNITSPEDFYKRCEIASFIATMQSLYTDFKFLSNTTKEIAERDRAIGVSITCLYDAHILTGEVLEKGAKIVVETNKKYAKYFNINPSKRCTTVKPSGSATILLEGYCSGIHPAHDYKYIRRVRTTDISPEWKHLKDTPLAKHENGEYIISFPIEYKGDKTKLQVNAVEHMKYVGFVKHFWVNKGTNTYEGTNIPNNVSCTIEVAENEWDKVAALLYCNSHLYTGVSFLPKFDQYYPNLPFSRLYTEEEQKEYEDMLEYINTHDIDFNAIMSEKIEDDAGTLAGAACSAGGCEIK